MCSQDKEKTGWWTAGISARVAICNLAWPSPTSPGFDASTPLQTPQSFPKLEQLLFFQRSVFLPLCLPLLEFPFLSLCPHVKVLCFLQDPYLSMKYLLVGINLTPFLFFIYLSAKELVTFTLFVGMSPNSIKKPSPCRRMVTSPHCA